MEKILKKNSLTQWVAALSSYDIYGPREKNNRWDFQKISKKHPLTLNSRQTLQSAKKIIFPQKETFFKYETTGKNGIKITETDSQVKPFVIFGVRPCDAMALNLTDRVFDGDIKDSYYWKRRDAATLVGLTCSTPPSPNCFCTSVNGSPHSTEGLDILMTELDDCYSVEAVTHKGQRLIKEAESLFRSFEAKEKNLRDKIFEESDKLVSRKVENASQIPEKLKGMFDSPFWQEHVDACIKCGICTFLCPTCHCFDISDEVDAPSPLKGKRVRTWDNCQFPDFTMHSSGHNPRPNRASRLRQRILHKYRYFVELHQEYQCTGCGRCVSHCPVGIDIIEVLNKVNEYGS